VVERDGNVGARRGSAWREVVAGGLLVAAFVTWLSSLSRIEREALTSMGDLGLAPLLPAGFHVALALTTVAFTLVVVRTRPVAMLAGASVALVVAIVQATPAVLYGTPRYPFVYKHLGVTEFVQRVGGLDLGIDAYFNWAGFFALGAFTAELAGLPDAFDLAVWSPLVMSAAFVAAVGFLASALTKDARLAWVTVWFFALANWIGQDYYAPQSIGFLLHLVVLGLYCHWFAQRRWRLASSAIRAPRADGANLELEAAQERDTTPGQRAAVLVAIVLVFAALVSAHQLSPFVTLASVTVLTMLGIGGARFLPVVMVSLLVAWFVTMAEPFLAGHLGSLLAAVGRLFDNLSLASRPLTAPVDAAISAERALVLSVRQWMTIGIAALAVLGGMRRVRRGYIDVAALALLVTPATLIALQPYGGEMILRIYLFSLPLAAWFMGALVFANRASGRSFVAPLTLIAISAALIPATLVAAYGNESMNHITPAEIAAVDAIYAGAPSGSLVVTATNNAPVRHARYEDIVYLELVDLPAIGRAPTGGGEADATLAAAVADDIAAAVASGGHDAAFLLFTRNQVANARLFGLLPGVDLGSLEAALAASERFVTMFDDEHARVLALAPGPTEEAP